MFHNQSKIRIEVDIIQSKQNECLCRIKLEQQQATQQDIPQELGQKLKNKKKGGWIVT